MNTEKLSTILIADDTPTIRKLLRHYLSGSYQVVGEASNGHEAIRLVKEKGPDFVLMDLQMPSMGGIEATRHIARHHPGTTVVITSSADDMKSLETAMAAGARDYLTKPFEKDRVLESLAQLEEQNQDRSVAAVRSEDFAPGAESGPSWAPVLGASPQ